MSFESLLLNISLVIQMLLNFHNQDLQIDYISLKIVTPNYPKELIDYLFQIGFNCFEQSGQNIQNQFIIQVKNPIRESLANQWQVLFVQKNTNEILVHFTGDNGLKFYQLIQTNSIDWAYFPHPILHRFDLCYLRQNRENDPLPVVNFLTDLIKEIDKREKIFQLEKDSSPMNQMMGLFSRNQHFGSTLEA